MESTTEPAGRPSAALVALARIWRWARRRMGLKRVGFEQPKLWLIALAVGAVSGYAAIGFVLIVEALHQLYFTASETNLAAIASSLPPEVVFGGPFLAGCATALILRFFCPNGAPLGVADVIEARARRHAQLAPGESFASAGAAAVALGLGASAGREGPVVVAGAGIATLATRLFKLEPFEARAILGCAVAAAVSASFNAPIAGALFALEVVLGHYAVRAFAPITIASVAGALLSRYHLGETPAFSLPDSALGPISQFPAFLLLGVVAAFAAMALMASVLIARETMDRVRTAIGAPLWIQPIVAGSVVGAIALIAPEVLGVGYETTTNALAGQFDFWTCVLLGVAKATAVAITLGGRFAGGVFSPALCLGALTGAAFGDLALDIFPSVNGSAGLYALAGMGAAAGAVLGAPISTTLIVFELTGDYATAVAVMVATSVATVATQQLAHKSFFHLQLGARGIDISESPRSFLLPNMRVGAHMRALGADDGPSESAAYALMKQGAVLTREDSLAKALALFEQNRRLVFLPVVEIARTAKGEESAAPPALLGGLYYIDALRAYNRALVEVHKEEHN